MKKAKKRPGTPKQTALAPKPAGQSALIAPKLPDGVASASPVPIQNASRTPPTRSQLLPGTPKPAATVASDWRHDTRVRDGKWLEERIELLWKLFFSDLRRSSPIQSNFGIVAKNRFGSISLRSGASLIRLNGLFADPELPLCFLDETLTHELIHYAHGFGSTLTRKYADPHRGGVIALEAAKRGLESLHAEGEEWRKNNWAAFYERKKPVSVRQSEMRTAVQESMWESFVSRPDARTLEEVRAVLEEVAPRFGFVDAPFEVEWLFATTRRTGTSYLYSEIEVLKLHGLLSDRMVPNVVIEFELGYWLAREAVGGNWNHIRHLLITSGSEEVVKQAMEWRDKVWGGFRQTRHPLR